MACSAPSANLSDIYRALAEGAEMLQLKARFADRNPSEVFRMYHDRFFVARGRILNLTAVDVLPNRFITVRALDAAVARLASEDATVKFSEIAHFLIPGIQLLIAHESAARGTAHLQQQHQRLTGVGLRSIKSSLGKIANRAGF